MIFRISSLVASLLLLFYLGLQFTNAGTANTIRPGQSLNTKDFIFSPERKFALGFTSPNYSENIYVGVVSIISTSVVWVANREQPFVNSSAVLTFNQEGDLVVSDGSWSYKVTNTSAGNDTYAMLLDTGNLILTNRAEEVLWQSFDYPACILLPGMKIKDAKTGWSLLSWTSYYDPTPGPFSLHLSSQKELVLMEGSRPYWSSRLVDDLAAIFLIDGEYITWRRNYTNTTSEVMLYDFGGLVLQVYNQHLQMLNYSFLSKCAGTTSPCGDFKICNETLDYPCECLPGFILGMNKCERKIELQCSNSTKVQQNWFRPISRVVLPSNPLQLHISNTSDCKSTCLNNCSCTGYAYDQEDRCLVWSGPLLDLKQVLADNVYQTDFYLKLATSDNTKETNSTSGIVPEYENSKVRGNNKMQKIVIPVASIAVLFTMGLFVYHVKIKLRRKGKNLLLLDLGMTQMTNTLEHGDGGKRDVQMPLFSFASICAATDNFAIANKLGEGGFGPVYKGRLLKGDEVAIKRLSKRSGQGWEELKNEAMLIAKLQHKNLVKLFGCCIERDEKILIYEYLPNKSLDFFLFDLKKRRTLIWGTRIQIIEGIAQGLAYLHQYSRLRIIHRDLKPSNILLDINMNPKISDFGIARIFRGNESQANTNRIAGTQGYMPPEYILEGSFSIKSDVFSFGILFLEILSGKKNIGFNQTGSLHLITYAWELWTNDEGANLVDPLLDNIPSIHMVLRYVNIALLCVQESAEDRPTMSDIVTMLSYENAIVPYPKEPAFLNVRSMMKANPVDTTGPETCSVNDITQSIMEGR